MAYAWPKAIGRGICTLHRTDSHTFPDGGRRGLTPPSPLEQFTVVLYDTRTKSTVVTIFFFLSSTPTPIHILKADPIKSTQGRGRLIKLPNLSEVFKNNKNKKWWPWQFYCVCNSVKFLLTNNLLLTFINIQTKS